jgi:hypothetical protein
MYLPASATPSPSTEHPPPVIIDFFFEKGCGECARINAQIIPQLEERYEGFYELREHNIGIKTNYLRLIRYQKHLNITENKPVTMVLDYTTALNGFAEIKSALFQQMDIRIANRMSPDWTPPDPIPTASHEQQDRTLDSRVNTFTWGAVILAGLSDGINPCAISTLVFFISLLSVSRIRGGSIIIVGTCFCVASFLTYLAIGFGLLQGIRSLEVFPNIQKTINTALAMILLLLSGISFLDAWRYAKSGKAKDVVLQLPKAIKKLSHWAMRKGLKTGSLAIAGIGIGVIVTALETLCTGQIYLPTLTLVIKSEGASATKAWHYLLAYNLMFILPLAIVFILTFYGLQLKTLQSWSKNNVVISKLLLGLLFLLLSSLIWLI